jgi:hypothetical protein
LFAEVRGKPLSAKEIPLFFQAVVEARAAGATDPMIARKILDADRTAAAWDPPNLARAAVKELLLSYQSAVRFPPGQQRTSLGHVLRDLDFARGSLARTPRPDPGDEGLALWQVQAAWADAHAADLHAATTWPVPAATAAG